MIKKIALYLILFLFTTLPLVTAQSIDQTLSTVNFSISNFKVNTVDGAFKKMDGEINFNAENLNSSNFNVCISAASIFTDNEKRDEHLRNEDFFDVKKFPTICFISNDIRKTDNGYESNGKLTLHGITKVVTIDFNKDKNSFTGQLNINRLDFNLGEDTGTFTVGNEVEIEIKCVLKE
ncbi:YceI family protein [Flammeovirga kamogawensis]|uniref:YceI family protein n=1 Tax=Flammeovirga kamogawensis TaxID=373891 RepID=A0ABX8GZ08_9BACT|nr:YceI family protein [Flammeovirga kamogawensis]MBB6459284.1 polyisoprenoid-binding protein YceI [Flammeovirga kamogawensis]QWG08844.1 YceI family protein [Flammeovirga kamogawensis]TRX67134.1 YceI family protein [Flammeovirga kamogawensis]